MDSFVEDDNDQNDAPIYDDDKVDVFFDDHKGNNKSTNAEEGVQSI